MSTYKTRSEQRQICRALLRGNPDHAIEKEFDLAPGEIERFRTLCDSIEAKVINSRQVIKEHAGIVIRRPIQILYLAAIFVVSICVFGAYQLVTRISADDSASLALISPAATLIAVAVAALGWAFGSWVSHRNSRVQHTINLVATRFTQTAFIDHLATFHALLRKAPNRTITFELAKSLQASDAADVKAYESIQYVLNYFEFIALGVLTGDLDINIIRKSLRGNIIFYFNACQPFIHEMRKKNPKGWEHLVKLKEHFQEPH